MANIVTCDCKPLARIFSYGDSLPLDGVDLRTAIAPQEYMNDRTIDTMDLPYCQTIGAEAFRGSSIEEINVPICTTIGNNAFTGSDIKGGDFSSVTTIGNRAFYDVRFEANAQLNFSSIQEIGEYAFWVNYYSGLHPNVTINITNVIRIGNNAFRSNTGAFGNKPLNLPYCTHIGEYAFACVDNSSSALTFSEIVLPSIIEIGQRAFQAAHVATKAVKFGKHLTVMGSNIFAIVGSSAMRDGDLYVEAVTPPHLDGELASEGQKPNHIYVPKDSVSSYKVASQWSYYADVIEEFPEGYIPIS